MKLPATFIIRDIELNDRARWEPLWRAYSRRPIPEEVTEMTAQLGSVCYLQDMFTVEIARGRGVGRA